MADALAPVALSAAQAVRRLLQHRRLAYSGEAMAGVATSESVVQQLERHGVYARGARLQARDLRHLELPALLQLSDARWVLVARQGPRQVSAEDAGGALHEVPWKVLLPALSGVVVDLIPELPPGASLWSRVLRLVGSQRRALYQVGALALMAQGFNLLVPQLTRILVDQAFPQGATSLFQVIIIGMALVALFDGWTKWLQQRLVNAMHVRLDAFLERGLLAHLLRLPYPFLADRTLSQLMQGFHGFATARALLTGDVMAALLGGITATAFLVLMAQTMPAPTLLVVAVGMVTIAIKLAAGRRLELVERQQVKALVEQRGVATELFSHIAMLKAAGAERRGVDHWLSLLRRERRIDLRGRRLALAATVMVALLGQLQLQGLWIWGGLRVMDGSLQLGELLAFTLMASAFQAAVSGFSQSVITFWTARPYLQEAQTLLAQPPEPDVPRMVAPTAPAAIEIEDLWFRYGNDRPWVFSGLALDIRPGEIHHLAGPSGFGKSTLMKLVAGLHEPQRGSIRIAGGTTRQARAMVMYLPQFVRLFNASILENMRLLSGGAARAELIAAAELTGLDAYLDSLPMGYDTSLAQNGANFSGGQRQLIALTAVLASARPVLLLDEAMANMDPLRWAKLVDSSLFRGRTILYTSHDECRLVARPDQANMPRRESQA